MINKVFDGSCRSVNAKTIGTAATFATKGA
jgi:hypothetical protein